MFQVRVKRQDRFYEARMQRAKGAQVHPALQACASMHCVPLRDCLLMQISPSRSPLSSSMWLQAFEHGTIAALQHMTLSASHITYEWALLQVAAEKRELERDISLVRAPDALLAQAQAGDKILVPVEEAPQVGTATGRHHNDASTMFHGDFNV